MADEIDEKIYSNDYMAVFTNGTMTFSDGQVEKNRVRLMLNGI